MNMKTPLSQVRGLGSAKEGTDHFWKQRLSAVSTLILAVIFVCIMICLIGADYEAVASAFTSPLIAIVFLLFIISGIYHMRLGMQVIIEDYITNETTKILALMGNTFFALAMGSLSIFSILKLAL